MAGMAGRKAGGRPECRKDRGSGRGTIPRLFVHQAKTGQRPPGCRFSPTFVPLPTKLLHLFCLLSLFHFPTDVPFYALLCNCICSAFRPFSAPHLFHSTSFPRGPACILLSHVPRLFRPVTRLRLFLLPYVSTPPCLFCCQLLVRFQCSFRFVLHLPFPHPFCFPAPAALVLPQHCFIACPLCGVSAFAQAHQLFGFCRRAVLFLFTLAVADAGMLFPIPVSCLTLSPASVCVAAACPLAHLPTCPLADFIRASTGEVRFPADDRERKGIFMRDAREAWMRSASG